jgi:hypothetical protein
LPADCSTFLEARKRELAELEEQTAAARRQEEAVEQERTAQQEKVREAVEVVDAAQAATQKRLETTEAFRVQLERTKVADAVTKHAEEKATLAENNRAEKGQPYEADPLISTCLDAITSPSRIRFCGTPSGLFAIPMRPSVCGTMLTFGHLNVTAHNIWPDSASRNQPVVPRRGIC